MFFSLSIVSLDIDKSHYSFCKWKEREVTNLNYQFEEEPQVLRESKKIDILNEVRKLSSVYIP